MMPSLLPLKFHSWLSCLLAVLLPGLLQAAPDNVEQVVTHQGRTATLRLSRLDLRGQYFELLAQNSAGTYDTTTAVPERSYLGMVDEFPGAVSAGILKDDGTFWGAVIFDRGGTWHTLGGAVTSTRYDNARPNFAFPTLELTPGQAGTTTYGFDIAADVNSDSFTATGSSIAKSFEGVEYTMTVLRALYMSNALLRPRLARVVIRTSAGVDPLKGMSSNATLPALKTEWLANHASANRDFVALAGRSMGGLSYSPGIGTPWGYTVQPSESDGNFWVFLRHELAHNMNVVHADGGGPEGETINGRDNNGYARLGTSELELMLNHRDSVVAQYGNEGTFTAIHLPPYACLDSAVIQRPGATTVTLDVMANDHDANGHAITGIVSFDTVSNQEGTVTLTGSGTSARLVYTPPPDFAGFDWFYYTVTDSSGQTATGLVTIDVNPPDTSFAGWWRLDETSGADYRDSSPMDTDVSSENISSGVAGKFGKAANFTTSSSQVPVLRTSLGSASATITAWIKRPSTITQAANAGIVFNRGTTAAGLHFGTANELRYTWNNNFFNWNSGLIPPADQWVLVALVVEPTKATIYMHDGTTLSSATNNGTHNPAITSGIIHLGRETFSSSRRFVGTMDDVRMFRRALSQAELLALVEGGPAETPSPFDTAAGVADTTLTWQPDPQATRHEVYVGTDSAALSSATTASPEYMGSTPLAAWSFPGNAGMTYYWRIDSVNATRTVPGKIWSFSTGTTVAPPDPFNGLLARWKLDEPAGTLAASTTGTTTGTVVGAPARIAGVDGNAISFDGVNDGVTTGVPLLSNRTSFTMAGWYRSPLTTGNRVALWGQNDIIEFGINGTNLSIFTSGGGSFSVPIPTPNQWHHVACVGDGFSLKIYIDGLLAASGGSYVANSYGTSTGSGFNIGTATWDASGNWFTGQIDEVRVYGRALSDLEIYHQVNPVPRHEVAVTPSPSQGGSATGSGTFTQGSTQPITAPAAQGWRFVNWSGTGIANPSVPSATVHVDAAKTVTAHFEAIHPDANSNGIHDEWETIKFGNAAPGANPPDEDPDRDGLSNLLEYAFDTHPLLPNVSPVAHDLVPMAGGKHLRLSVAKNPEATHLAYSVEVSGDLADPSWTWVGTTVEADTLTELRVRDDTGTTSSSRRFIRLKVTAE
jgi:hypothetical protein